MQILRKFPFFEKIRKTLNPLYERECFVEEKLSKLPSNTLLLDAGCGSQSFKKFCGHLNYRAQDFGKYKGDLKETFNVKPEYTYGDLDYVGDIWNIDERDSTFDNILCTEVFEHIPYPIETVKEFRRLLKKNGKLILTAPCNSLRHMDPYYFYSGFSDRWYEKILNESGFEIISISPVGDHYRWVSTELLRTMLSHSLFAKILLLPAFIFYYSRKKNENSINSLCYGYHIEAKKIN
jgi:SAM-dependent methyltransferase